MPYTPPPHNSRQLQTRRSPLASFGAGLILLPALVVASLPTPAAAYDFVPFGSTVIDDSQLNPGQQVTFQSKRKNQGFSYFGGVTDHSRYYFSTDGTISSSDGRMLNAAGTNNCVDSFATLESSGEVSPLITHTCTLPDTVTRGNTYHLGYCIEATSSQFDDDSSNDCSAGVSVVINNPDLAVGSVTVSDSTVFPGQTITMAVSVAHIGLGDATAASILLLYFWATEASLSDTSTPPLGSDAVPSLAAGGASVSFSKAVTVPSSLTLSATYYMGVCVATQSGEQSTSNNCASLTVTATYFDWQVSSAAISDTTVGPGQTTTLSATVRNAGDLEAAASTLRYYLSPDDSLSTSDDTPFCLTAQPALGAGSSATANVACQLPESLTHGATYYVFACLDEQLGEGVTNNNCSTATPLSVDFADWQVSDVVVDDDRVSPSQTITIAAKGRNLGNQTVGATTLRFYWSTDTVVTSADTQLCAVVVAGLIADSETTLSAACAVPASATAGDYYVGACVDVLSGESRADNNCAVGVAVGIDNFDWTVEPGSVAIDNSTVRPGQSIALGATVRNVGGLSASTTTLSFYWSTDSSISTTDTQLCEVAVPSLVADSGSALSAACAVPASATAGDYYVGACVDTQSGEESVANNCSAGVAVGIHAFDWIVVAGSVSIDDATLKPGQSIALGATVRNVGRLAAGATTLRFHWSTDTVFTSADTQLCEVAVPSLVAGSSGTLSATTCAVPASATAGDYYVGACVDTQSEELRTDNNCSAGVAVGIDNFDWTVVAGSVSIDDATLKPGQSIALGATVRNVGGLAAGATTLRFYWSTDTVFTSADTQLCEVAVPSLVADSGSALSATTCAVPASATAGDYYVGACVDTQSGEQPSSAGGSDNCSAGVAVGIDNFDWIVVAGSVSIDDATLKQGQSIALGATVRNVGGVAAGATTLRFYWSTDSSISTTDTQLCEVAVPSLVADSGATLSAACAVPAAATAGDYYVGACVDTQSGEESVANNCSAGVAVSIDNFDWIVEPGSVSIDDATLKPGQSIALGATVRNVGGVAAGATTTLRFYWSTDSSISTTDTQLCEVAVPSLVVDSGATLSAVCAVPAAAEDGDYHVGACVDTQSGEESVANNCSAGIPVAVSATSLDVDENGAVETVDATLVLRVLLLPGSIRESLLAGDASVAGLVVAGFPALDANEAAIVGLAVELGAQGAGSDMDVDQNGAVETVDATLVLRVLLLPGSIRESLLAGDASVAGLVVAGFPALDANEAAIVRRVLGLIGN